MKDTILALHKFIGDHIKDINTMTSKDIAFLTPYVNLTVGLQEMHEFQEDMEPVSKPNKMAEPYDSKKPMEQSKPHAGMPMMGGN